VYDYKCLPYYENRLFSTRVDNRLNVIRMFQTSVLLGKNL